MDYLLSIDKAFIASIAKHLRQNINFIFILFKDLLFYYIIIAAAVVVVVLF